MAYRSGGYILKKKVNNLVKGGEGKKETEEKIIFDQVIQYVLSASIEEFADLSVSRLALFFNMERSKLSRIFKRRMNLTLELFLLREKMIRAAFLLMSNKDITVKEVAKQLGFCACDYFIKKFKGYYGTRPGSYKELKISAPGNDDHGNSNKNIKKRHLKQHQSSDQQQQAGKGQFLPGQTGPALEVKNEKLCDNCCYKQVALNSGELLKN